MPLYLSEHRGAKRAKNGTKSDKKSYFQDLRNLGISTQAGHTPLCQPVSISHLIFLLRGKTQFLGFFRILKFINTY